MGELYMIRKYKVVDILDTIMELDKIAYPDYIVSKQWYLDRYLGEEDVYAYIIDNEIVGYSCITPVHFELISAICNSVLDGDGSISKYMFGSDGSKYLYLSSCVVKQEYRNKGICTKLLKETLTDIQPHYSIYVLANKMSQGLLTKAGFYDVRTSKNKNQKTTYIPMSFMKI
jgi:ribosomal protein S18 acetylase RimI-like enzyme